MLIERVIGATRTLGAPQDWDQSKTVCVGLPIRDVMTEQGPFMISAWSPTPEELELLKEGVTLKLWIAGVSHPVVSLSVQELPE